ncbi:hypothetical protein ACH4TV_31460 [Streptomyces sp. NPDC020898]|uniref:hypothetical protein n=1 Tax=Streptomyces sp. NPDC020898 TaxID=3365101 RepID=UPI00379AB330
MSEHHAARASGRVTAADAAALTDVLTLVDPASAPTEVEDDTPQTLAEEDVTDTFVSEAESARSGFTHVRVVLSDGIAHDDVTPADAPNGWKPTTAADGRTVAGPALKTGTDAAYKIRVRRLPDAEQLVLGGGVWWPAGRRATSGI